MPWKNGGGITHELAVFPPGAALADFDCRISMAEVASDGPFSRFDGIDRTLCLMDGAGITLAFADHDITLNEAAQTASFPGEAEVSGQLVQGAILDLNVMTRRDRLHHRVTVLKLAGDADLSDLPVRALVCQQGSVHADGHDLRPRDCLIAGDGDGARIARVSGHGIAVLIHWDAV